MGEISITFLFLPVPARWNQLIEYVVYKLYELIEYVPVV